MFWFMYYIVWLYDNLNLAPDLLPVLFLCRCALPIVHTQSGGVVSTKFQAPLNAKLTGLGSTTWVSVHKIAWDEGVID